MSRYVYGGSLPSSEKLQRDADEEERRSWASADSRDEELPSQLRCVLQVHNAGSEPFTFTTALQTHFAAEDISLYPKLVKTVGLNGKYVLDYSASSMRPNLRVEDRDQITYGREQVDRVYVDCDGKGDIMHCPGSQSHYELVNKEGFTDVVLQNPGLTNPGEARYFVGMHSARAARPVTLQPGEYWYGEMIIKAHRKYWDLLPWESDNVSGVPGPRRSPSLEDVVSAGDDGSPSFDPPEVYYTMSPEEEEEVKRESKAFDAFTEAKQEEWEALIEEGRGRGQEYEKFWNQDFWREWRARRREHDDDEDGDEEQ